MLPTCVAASGPAAAAAAAASSSHVAVPVKKVAVDQWLHWLSGYSIVAQCASQMHST